MWLPFNASDGIFDIFPPGVREWHDSRTTSLISVTSFSHPLTEDAELHTAAVNITLLLRKNLLRSRHFTI